jgi:hypothetical protein
MFKEHRKKVIQKSKNDREEQIKRRTNKEKNKKD